MTAQRGPLRRLATQLAASAEMEGYGGDGVRAWITVLGGRTITGQGWHGDEAVADLVTNLIAWAQEEGQ